MADRYEIKLSGSGGQGVVLASIILAEASALYDGKNAVQTQSYGPESRGGYSSSMVIISDEDIDYPKSTKVDVLLALTQEAADKYAGDIKDDGVLIVDEELVRDVPEGKYKVHKLPIVNTARTQVGNTVVTNIVALGAIVGLTEAFSVGGVKKALLSKIPKGTEQLNTRAFEAGIKLVEEVVRNMDLNPEALDQHEKTLKEMMNGPVTLGACCGCAMCVVTCPYGVIKYNPETMVPYIAKPKNGPDYCPISEEIGCNVCANSCIRLGCGAERPIRPEELDVAIFGRERDEHELAGVIRFICLAKGTSSNIVTNAQDGGAVTSLLRCAFEEGIIDGAAVAGPSENLWVEPVPTVVKNAEELMRTSKSWYTYCATPMALKEALDKYKLQKLALVGVPCEISAYAKTLGADTEFIAAERGEKNIEKQKKHLKQYVEAVQLAIGLFCTETLDFKGFIYDYIQGELGINPQDIVKVNIKGRLIIDLKDGTRIEKPLAEAKKYKREQCNYCNDFSAEHADISAGSVGGDGWTVLVVRSERGENILKRAVEKGYLEVKDTSENERPVKLMKKFTEAKRKEASEHYVSIGSQKT